jgi:NADH-quinone oxidoreductase subunit M
MVELASWPLLSTLLSLPLLGALLTALWRRKSWAQWVALGTAMLTLFCSLLIVAVFDDQDPDFQLLDSATWIPGVNINYLLGVDGLSLLFLPATALLFCGSVVAGWRQHAPAALPGVYFALLLLLEAATLGVFCALDSILFFCFWEFTLLPLYFLVSLWGLGAGRQAAAVRYFLVMLAGGVPLLFGLLALAFGHAELSGALRFDLPTLLATALPERTQYLVFLLLLAGFGVKVPLLPLHTWLPALAMGAPAAVTAVLVGLKLGAYGLIRFAIPLAPLAARELHWLLAGFGTVAILYGSVAALAQSNLRAMLAYASVSHVGLVVLGLASFSVSALQGALLQLLNFSVAAHGQAIESEILLARPLVARSATERGRTAVARCSTRLLPE